MKDITIKMIFASIMLASAIGLFTYCDWWKKTHSSSEIIDYEDAYINVKAFRNEFARAKNIDSMFANDIQEREFMSDKVKVIRNEKYDMQAVSIPKDPSRGNYHLILNDSIFKIKIIRIKH